MTEAAPIQRERLGLLTEEELAEVLNIKPNTLTVWRAAGQGPRFVKLGKGVFYRYADVEDWINAHIAAVKAA